MTLENICDNREIESNFKVLSTYVYRRYSTSTDECVEESEQKETLSGEVLFTKSQLKSLVSSIPKNTSIARIELYRVWEDCTPGSYARDHTIIGIVLSDQTVKPIFKEDRFYSNDELREIKFAKIG
jgi:translation elongation factor EF-Ts